MAPVEMQTHLALFTLFLFLVLHLYFVPYESAKGPLHIMESFALSVGWFTMWGGLLMYQLFNDPDVADKPHAPSMPVNQANIQAVGSR